jgi:DNA repair exonuclease SbcCD ATPase subunit
MRLDRLRVSAFGAHEVSTLADLRGQTPARRLFLPDELDAALVADAVAWALHGEGSEQGAAAEVEVELSAGGESIRVRRRGGDQEDGGGVVAWRRTGLRDDAEAGEPAATGEGDLAELLSALGVAPAGALRVALSARASAIAAQLHDDTALAALLEEGPGDQVAADVEQRLEDLLLEVEGEADLVRIRRAEALAQASEQLGDEAADSLTLEELDERREEARLRLAVARSAVEQLGQSAVQARDLIETARARQVRLDELARARGRLRAAENREAEIGLLKRELERAESAAGLARSERKLTDKKSLKAEEASARELRKAEDARRDLLARREASAARLRKAEREAEDLAAQRERLLELDDLEGVLALFERTQASLGESEVVREREQARRAAADASLQDLMVRHEAATRALERARSALGDEGARRLEELRESLSESERLLAAVERLVEVQENRRQVTKLHATTMIHLDRTRRAHDSELRLLQRRLSGDGPPPEEEEIERQRVATAALESDLTRLEKEQGEQEAAVQELGAEVLRLRQDLGNQAYVEPAELVAVTATLREELEEAGAPAEALARAEAESSRLSEERSGLERELTEAEAALTAARAKEESERDLAAELATRVPEGLRTREALARERDAIGSSLAAHEAELADASSAAAADAEALAAGEDACAAARDRQLEASAVVERAHENLAAVVQEAGFRDIADYQDAKREASERKAATARLSSLETELEEARRAHRELEGLTNVPVLRESDRSELEQDEWERRQRERKERLQSGRVHRDRELLEGLLEQLESEHAAARADEESLAEAWEAVERASAATAGFAESLRALRERHQLLSQLTDLAAGRVGPPGGFAGSLRASVAGEVGARAGHWCRRLSGGELHLAAERKGRGWSLELREVHGRGRRGIEDLSLEERWLTGLALSLARGEAAVLLAGAAAPESVIVDRLPSLADPAAQERVSRWLTRLEDCGRRAFSGVGEAGIAEGLPVLERRRSVAAGGVG